MAKCNTYINDGLSSAFPIIPHQSKGSELKWLRILCSDLRISFSQILNNVSVLINFITMCSVIIKIIVKI